MYDRNSFKLIKNQQKGDQNHRSINNNKKQSELNVSCVSSPGETWCDTETTVGGQQI